MLIILRRALWLVTLLMLVSACSDDESHGYTCDLIAEPGLRVTIRGAGNRDGGDLTVRVRDGDYVEELDCESVGDSFVCEGATERPGTYLIEVVGTSGDVFASEEVTVTSGKCHVMLKEVTI